MQDTRFWAHYCLMDHGLEYVERDRECNWCGARKEDIPIEREGIEGQAPSAPVRQFIARAA